MSGFESCHIDWLPFQIDPVAATAIGRNSLQCLWKPIHKCIYPSVTNPPSFSDMEIGDVFVCPDALPTSDLVNHVFVVVETLGCYRSLGSQNIAECLAPFKANDFIYVIEPWMVIKGDGHTPGAIKYQWTGTERLDTGVWRQSVEEKPSDLLNWQSALRMPSRYSRQLYNIASVSIVRVSTATNELAESLGFLPLKRASPAEAFIDTYRNMCWVKGSKSNAYVDWAWIFDVTKLS